LASVASNTGPTVLTHKRKANMRPIMEDTAKQGSFKLGESVHCDLDSLS